MFSSNTAEILNISNEVKKKPNVLKKILFIHKKLKEIAKYENSYKEKFQLAKLNLAQVSQIKNLESDLNLFLIAYETEKIVSHDKQSILNKINILLDEYLDVCKYSNKNQSQDEFSKFFEE